MIIVVGIITGVGMWLAAILASYHSKVAEASPNGQQLGACPRTVRARQNGGSAEQGLEEEVEELGVRGWRGGCRSLPEIVGCAVFDVLY